MEQLRQRHRHSVINTEVFIRREPADHASIGVYLVAQPRSTRLTQTPEVPPHQEDERPLIRCKVERCEILREQTECPRRVSTYVKCRSRHREVEPSLTIGARAATHSGFDCLRRRLEPSSHHVGTRLRI